MAPKDEGTIVTALPGTARRGRPVEDFEHFGPEREDEPGRSGVCLLQEFEGPPAVPVPQDVGLQVSGGGVAGHPAEGQGLILKAAVQVPQGHLQKGLVRKFALQGLRER